MHDEKELIQTQRLDIWLWHARLSKTRTISSKLIKEGYVYVNSNRIIKTAYNIKKEDIITLPYSNIIRVVKVTGFSKQRISAKNCSFLYKEILEK